MTMANGNHTAAARPWALVTGASAGIGAACARELARRGYDLVLVARRGATMRALAEELSGRPGCRSQVREADLSDPASIIDLVAWLAREGIAIEFLVNNAGYGMPGTLVSQPWDRHRSYLELMVVAPVALCRHLLPDMQQRKRGYVLNVASLAGFLPGTRGNTLYGASKAFLVRFSQSLALENRTYGIHATALCPGFTRSEFHDVSGTRDLADRLPRWLWLDADTVAREGIEACLRGDVVRVTGWVNRAIKAMMDLLPDAWALELTKRQAGRIRREQPSG